MAPDPERFRDIVLNPCNASATRRNWAAVRDALEGLVEQEQEPTPTDPSAGGGSQLIFFEVQVTDIGAASVAVKEVLYDSGSSSWGATGADYTAYDWSGRDQFSVNFEQGFLGIGRINTNIAADALEILAIEGRARFVQGTLDEPMGATTTKQAQITVTDFWGDTINGRSPGANVIIHDETNMAPAATVGSVALAIWDEKRQGYVMIAPWTGNQAPGQAAIVQVKGGDAGLGCDDSVQDDSFCLFSGRVQNISLAGDLCNEKFTDGATCWIIDGRSCHGTPRLGHLERYVAVSTSVTFDPDPGGQNSDERIVYAVVDYSPSFRWFRILNDIETLVLPSAETNDLKCRKHDCGGEQDDDAPSAWGRWEDINPCTRDLGVIDAEPKLIYFPRYRHRCKPADEQDEKEKCDSKDTDPDCRKNEWILAWWNPIAERWDAVTDADKCTETQDVSMVMVCDGDIIPSCCVFDGIKIKFWPRAGSYCDPVKERESVWIKCNTNANQLTDGFCEIGVRICDSFECQNEERPVYLIHCEQCEKCHCPDTDLNIVRFKIKVANPSGPCGFMHELDGEMHCLDSNPFVDGGSVNPGWYVHFDIVGVTPRIIYYAEPNDTLTYPNGVWLEIQCEETEGVILNAYDGLTFNPVAIPTPGDYSSGLLECQHLEFAGIPQYRVRTYSYGIWAECLQGTTGLTNYVFYALKKGFATVPVNPVCSGQTKPVIASPDFVISDAEGTLELRACCDNFQVICLNDLHFACSAGESTELPLPFLVGAVGGTTVCSMCDHAGPGHTFGGCPCDWIVKSGSSPVCVLGPNPCNVGPFPSLTEHLCCDNPQNRICFEFDWPAPMPIG